jgi:hypothetical protein
VPVREPKPGDYANHSHELNAGTSRSMKHADGHRQKWCS